MRRPKFDFIIAVWGDWHIDTFNRATLPTLLSPGNLPTVVQHYSARVRILTRESDRDAIAALPAMTQLMQLVPTEIVAATVRQYVDAPTHHAWWRDAAQVAGARKAFAVFMHPDVIWPDSAVTNLCKPLAAGKRAVIAPPHLRVASETCLPALDTMPRTEGALQIAPAAVIALGMQHLHPLMATAIVDARQGRPGIEALWPVESDGFVLAQTTREITAFDPSRCEISDCTMLTNAVTFDDIYCSRSSDDFTMLSLAPLTYEFNLFSSRRPSDERMLAHWSTVPENDTPLNAELVSRLIRLHRRPIDEARWQSVECEANAWVARYLRWREIYQIAGEIRAHGRYLAAGIIALAIYAIDLAAHIPAITPATFFVPDDNAILKLPRSTLDILLAPGHEHTLLRFLKAHVIEGLPREIAAGLPSDVKIQETIAINSHRIHFINQCLTL